MAKSGETYSGREIWRDLFHVGVVIGALALTVAGVEALSD